MKPIDFAKAAGVAVALLVLNVLIATLVILFYSLVIEPGHPSEFYNAAALRIAPWCSHIFGTALFFGAGWLCARRRPDRNGFLFAAAFTVLYGIIDAIIGVGSSTPSMVGQGRDYIVSASKPAVMVRQQLSSDTCATTYNYAPYTYPHPLALIQ